MHYAKLIERVDRPQTLFYIDPPYYNCEDYYGKGIFARDDFSRLSTLLASISGKFIMSINDVPEIRTLYSAFKIQEVDTSYSLPGADRKKGVTELLITNF
jgi:DNA adenine methylase